MVDATAGGSLMRMTSNDAYQLLDDMANNAFNWQSERANRKPASIHSIDTLSSLSAQMELLNNKMDNMNVSSHQTQDITYAMNGGEQDMEPQDCSFSEQVNYMGNFQRGKTTFKDQFKTSFKIIVGNVSF